MIFFHTRITLGAFLLTVGTVAPIIHLLNGPLGGTLAILLVAIGAFLILTGIHDPDDDAKRHVT